MTCFNVQIMKQDSFTNGIEKRGNIDMKAEVMRKKKAA